MRLLLLLACASTVYAQSPARNHAQRTARASFACEECEALYDRAFDGLTAHARIAPPDEPGEPLALTGRVVLPDGTTPAPGVVLYVYHTNAEGRYPRSDEAADGARQHGTLRGWVRTGDDGAFEIRTIRPGPYPGGTAPAHLHVIVKESDRQPYRIADVVFDDDPRLTPARRADLSTRGGSGIVRLTRDAGGVWRGFRLIVLER